MGCIIFEFHNGLVGFGFGLVILVMLKDTQRMGHDLPVPVEFADMLCLELVSDHAVEDILKMTACADNVADVRPRLALAPVGEVATLHRHSLALHPKLREEPGEI